MSIPVSIHFSRLPDGDWEAHAHEHLLRARGATQDEARDAVVKLVVEAVALAGLHELVTPDEHSVATIEPAS